jgi:hypothetical protein
MAVDYGTPPSTLPEEWWTTETVALALQVTPDGVRWLARQGRITFTPTPSGQRLFRPRDVRQLVIERARHRAEEHQARTERRRKAARLATVRPKMMRMPWRRTTSGFAPSRDLRFGVPKRR